MSLFEKFTQLHMMAKPLIIGNVWNRQSAIIFEKLGYKAIGTSSAAIAASLGYEDGEIMPFERLIAVVRDIQSVTKLPLNVDIEAGYSRDIDEIIHHICQLAALGVVGINIEDSLANPEPMLVNANEFADIIRSIKSVKYTTPIFINARSDAYILKHKNAFDISYERARLYHEAGADMIFLPCLYDANIVKRLTDDCNIAINLMAGETMNVIDDFKNSNVKRISMGPFSYLMKDDHFEMRMQSVLLNHHVGALFGAFDAK